MGTKANPADFDCYDNAEPDEPLFTLLARDVCAPLTVRAWADARTLRLRENVEDATAIEVLTELDQIAEARSVADAMVAWRAEHR